MYDQLKNDFTVNLLNLDLSTNMINTILEQFDISCYNYDISKKCTEIVVYNDGLPELAKAFLIARKVEGLSDKTLYNYKKILEIFFFTIKKAPKQIQTDDITCFLYWYKRRNPDYEITDRSLDKILDCLRSFFKWLCYRRYIDFNPAEAIRPIKYEKKMKEALTEEELEIVRRNCITIKEKAILEVLFSTRCRVGELVNLKISDLDLKNRTVQLFGKGKKHRIGFLSVKAVFLIRDYLKTRTDTNEALFVSDRKPYNPLHECGVQKIFRNISARSNLSKPLSPHILRHTCSNILIQKGATIQDVQKILGHEEINTTLNYVKINMNQV